MQQMIAVAGININPVAGLKLAGDALPLRVGGAGININPVAGLKLAGFSDAGDGDLGPESTSTQSRD